jgi:hypothetical protein
MSQSDIPEGSGAGDRTQPPSINSQASRTDCKSADCCHHDKSQVQVALRTITDTLPEISKRLKQGFWKFTIADFINFVMLVLVGGTLLTARGQFQIAGQQFQIAERQSAISRDTLTYTTLLQLKRDSEQITEFLSSGAPALRRMNALSCELSGDSGQAQQAESETNHILDFYEFYYLAQHDYGLIKQSDWDQICAGAHDLLIDNCFTRNNAERIIQKRTSASFRQTMSACAAIK